MGAVKSQSAVEAAWEAYAAHRSREMYFPALADNPSHMAEASRLHAAFLALYDDRPRNAVVIPFRRSRV